MIDSNFEELSIRKQCELLKVNRSSHYYEACPKFEEQNIANTIHEIWMKHPFFGYRKIKAVLALQGVQVNHKKVQRIMHEMGICALYPKPKTSIRSNYNLLYPYLLKGVEITRPNQVWATDITYIKMADGFIYLLAIIDLYSRYIVGYTISISLEADFCVEALESALQKYNRPEIFNTDQGSQFTSNDWLKTLLINEVKISMDGKGRCFDNIFIERFWRTVKYEEVYLKSYDSVSEARQELDEFINFYNHERPHQSLQYKTPASLYQQR